MRDRPGSRGAISTARSIRLALAEEVPVHGQGAVLRSLKRTAADQTGSTIGLVAVSMVAVLSAVALAVDVGMLVTARNEAQRAADSAALAGATAFIDDPDNATPMAEARAEQYAELHVVRGDTVELIPAEDVQVIVDSMKVRVAVRLIQERANPVPTFFAAVFGVDAVDVAAVAAAEAHPAGAVGCLVPFALPDAWGDADGDGRYDLPDDANGDGIIGPGEEGEYYELCEWTYDAEGNLENNFDTCTGWGGEYRNPTGAAPAPPYIDDVGRPIVIKPGRPNQAMQPGWFFPWRAPGEQGGADYRENIASCISEEMYFGGELMESVDVEPGNMIGPTLQGIEDRIGTDDSWWEPGCVGGMMCIRSTTHGEGMAYNGTRLINVPLFNPTQVVKPGMQTIEFAGFAQMFLEGISGNNVNARWLRLHAFSPGEGGGGLAKGAFPLFVRLVE